MTAAESLSRRGRGEARPVAFVLSLGLAALAVVLLTGSVEGLASFDYLTAGFFAAGFFAMRLLPLRLPQGDEIPIVLMVGVCALGVMRTGEAIAASAVVGVADAAARFSYAPDPGALRRVLDAARAASVLAIVSAAQPVLRLSLTQANPTDLTLVAILTVGIAYAALDVVTVAVQERMAGGVSVVRGARLLLRPLGSVYLVHIAMAAVVLRVYPVLGLWAFGIAVLMTLILQSSFNLYLRIRRAYSETIEALAHAAELDRPQDAGHAQRVADLAMAVGRRMGLSSHELEHLRYAALLHEIGRLGHPQEGDGTDHALRGAAIVEKIPFLRPISPLIAGQHDIDESVTHLGSAIVGVCSRYDRLRMESGVRSAIGVLMQDEQGQRCRVAQVLQSIATADSGEL